MAKRCIIKSTPTLAFIPYFNTEDVTKGETATEKSASYQHEIKEDGMSRLQRTFSIDEFDRLSPEVNTVLQVACMSTFVGALYGGILESKGAYMEFFRNNQATVFKDHFIAKRALQDKVTLAFAKGAFKWAWRLTFFSTTYVGLSTVISVYRGKSGILEHIVAGAFTGATYKFNMGPRGWIVGGGLGVVLGTIAGGTTLGLLKLTGMTMEETRNYNSRWNDVRMKKFNEGVKRHMEDEQLAILTVHDRRIGDEGKTLDPINSNDKDNVGTNK